QTLVFNPLTWCSGSPDQQAKLIPELTVVLSSLLCIVFKVRCPLFPCPEGPFRSALDYNTKELLLCQHLFLKNFHFFLIFF
ncbi:MAG: hypothetical protein IJB69_02755, partial [Clostridia bacterium]|nr:hypothetical protein [Clostridia bacterium]